MTPNQKLTTFFICLTNILACSSTKGIRDKIYFEGKITYENAHVIKTDKVNSSYLDKIFGKSAELTFKDGNFLEKYDGGYMLEQLYNRKSGKIYVKRDISDTLYWSDCGEPGQRILRFEINPKKEKILNIECDELVTYYENKTVSFYFNSDTLKVNPDWYKDFTRSNKNLNTQKMKSIYLKYKIEYPDFIATVTATSISWETIDNKIFSIPSGKILIEDK